MKIVVSLLTEIFLKSTARPEQRAVAVGRVNTARPKTKKAANLFVRSLEDTKFIVSLESFAGIIRHFGELFLNAKQLVVFGHPVGAGS